MEKAINLLMGNEAIALGAIRAGVRVAAGYPGTPSSEVMEALARDAPGGVYVEWSVNEKAAMEVAAGAAISGARAIATMKQVGLNVASDPLMSLNYLGVKAGLVVVVADDPGPISSQTEQDTRSFCQFAKLAVFDPSSPEEAYSMAADAFDWSERVGRPVILRPTTRVCHGYATVEVGTGPERPAATTAAEPAFDRAGGRWVIFPKLAYASHMQIEKDLAALADGFSGYAGNHLRTARGTRLGVATGGVGWLYVQEALGSLGGEAAATCGLLKVGTVPIPERLAVEFLRGVDDALVIEELDPVIERALVFLCGRHGIPARVRGKLTGDMPVAGEYTPADVRSALRGILDAAALAPPKVSLASPTPPTMEPPSEAPPTMEPPSEAPPTIEPPTVAPPTEAPPTIEQSTVAPSLAPPPLPLPPPPPPPLPARPPVLCAGCPHRASFFAVKEAATAAAAAAASEPGRRSKPVWCGDIGCYTLANAMPLDMVDTCLCMGADITLAQGISRADPSALCFAFIGDSTFYHSGITGLANAAYNDADIIVCVLDNGTTAMTGGQENPGTGRRLSAGRPPSGPARRLDIASIAKSLGACDVQRVDAFNLSAAKAAVWHAVGLGGLRVIVFDGACIARAPKAEPCEVTLAACRGCGACVRKLGCPALTFGGKKAAIDATLCTGCGLCAQVCAFGAIVGGGREAAAAQDRGRP